MINFATYETNIDKRNWYKLHVAMNASYRYANITETKKKNMKKVMKSKKLMIAGTLDLKVDFESLGFHNK